MKYDLFKNELKLGQKVIYKTDRFITYIGKIVNIATHSILVECNNTNLQVFNKDNDILPVVVIGDVIKKEYFEV